MTWDPARAPCQAWAEHFRPSSSAGLWCLMLAEITLKISSLNIYKDLSRIMMKLSICMIRNYSQEG